METKVRSIGNALGIIIPKSLTTEMNLHADDAVELGVEHDRLVVSPNIVNENSRTVMICAVTHYETRKATSHFFVQVSPPKTTGLSQESLINTLQVRTIDRSRIIRKLGRLPKSKEPSLDYALSLALGTDREVKRL